MYLKMYLDEVTGKTLRDCFGSEAYFKTKAQENIAKIVSIFTDRKDLQYVAKLVPNQVIKSNEYNLSVSQYVEQEDTREVIDIEQLNEELEKIVARENELRNQINQIISSIEGN